MKRNLLVLAVYPLVLLVYLLLCALLVHTPGMVFWCGFGFTVFALLLAAGLTAAGMGKQTLWFPMQMSLLVFANLYFPVTLLLNFLFGGVFYLPLRVFASIHIICLGLFLVLLLLLYAARGSIREQSEQASRQTMEKQLFLTDVSTLQAKIPSLPESVRKPVSSLLKKLAETIQFSEFPGESLLSGSDSDLRTKVLALSREMDNLIAIQSENIESIETAVNELLQLAKSRNLEIKANKCGI